MADKKLSVVIMAKDFLADTLRGAKGKVKSWSEDVTKIAAGIGLADGFKEVGRFIKESVGLAAEAYPKLAAPFKQLQTTWTELKVQGGAALLEALTPVTPLLQRILSGGVALAKQLPDAIDGIRITWVGFTTRLKEFPDLARQAFGGALTAIAEFAAAAAPYLDAVLGTDTVALADRLSARGTALEQQGIRGQRGTRAAGAAREAAIASTTHDFGPRVAPETPEDKRAREAERERQQLLSRQRAQRIAAGGGGNSFTGTSSTGGNAGVEAALAAQGATGILGGGRTFGEGSQAGAVLAGERQFVPADLSFGTAFKAALEPLMAFNAEARTANQVLGELAGQSIDAVSSSLADMAVQLGATGQAITNPVKAVKGMVGEIAKTEGRYHVKRGFATIAAGGWPPNPVAVGAGLKEVAAGLALSAVGGAVGGGGGGGGGGTGGASFGGGLAPERFQRDQAGLMESRGTLTVVYDKGYVTPGDPGFQALVAETVRKGQFRQLDFRGR